MASAAEGAGNIRAELKTDLRPDKITLPLAAWIQIDDYMRARAAEIPDSTTNIYGFKCREEQPIRRSSFGEDANLEKPPAKPPKITYQESEFGRLDGAMKRMYRQLQQSFHIPFQKPNKPVLVESFTTLFQDTDYAHFVPFILPFANLLLDIKKFPTYNPLYSEALFRGEHDEAILTDPDTKKKEQNTSAYHGFLTTLLSQLDTSSKTFCALSYITSYGGLGHVIATVLWKEDETLHVGFYDPMYYVRIHGDSKDGYVDPLSIAYINWKRIMTELGRPVQIRNLSEFCVTSEKGIHCPQYVINAEYCPMYSLYFLFLYAKHGCPHSDEGFAATVRDAFIVEPAALVRNPCSANKQFRLVMIGFILLVILFGSKKKEDIQTAYALYGMLQSEVAVWSKNPNTGFVNHTFLFKENYEENQALPEGERQYPSTTIPGESGVHMKPVYPIFHPDVDTLIDSVMELPLMKTNTGGRRRMNKSTKRRSSRRRRRTQRR